MVFELGRDNLLLFQGECRSDFASIFIRREDVTRAEKHSGGTENLSLVTLHKSVTLDRDRAIYQHTAVTVCTLEHSPRATGEIIPVLGGREFKLLKVNDTDISRVAPADFTPIT
jgi:hypothetical protein